jgi:hypothetical protein
MRPLFLADGSCRAALLGLPRLELGELGRIPLLAAGAPSMQRNASLFPRARAAPALVFRRTLGLLLLFQQPLIGLLKFFPPFRWRWRSHAAHALRHLRGWLPRLPRLLGAQLLILII